MASSQIYATIPDLRERIERTRMTDDTHLIAILEAASRSIDNACNRNKDGFVASTSSAREFAGSGYNYIVVDEFTSVSRVEAKSTTTADYKEVTDYTPFSGAARFPDFSRTPYTGIMSPTRFIGGWNGNRVLPTVRITATWGYADVVPPEVREATVMQAARWYKRMQAAMADALANDQLGMLLYQQSLDPDIRRILVDGRLVRRTVA